jgi:hypothetical protein
MVESTVWMDYQYYNRRRKRQLRLSNISRAFAILFLIPGVVLPLLPAINYQRFSTAPAWGYLSLAIAGTALLANRVFATTEGHRRVAHTQRQLDEQLSLLRIDWARSQSQLPNDPLQPRDLLEPIALLRRAASDYYAIVNEETRAWGEAVMGGLDDLHRSLRPDKA